MTPTRTRRSFLAAAGSGTVALAGCTALDFGGEERTWDIDPVEHDKLVGAHYYPWYGQTEGWSDWLERVPGEPVLGEYDSADRDVINQHVKWAREHGINWFSISWADRGSWDHGRFIENDFLPAELGRDINFSILYESRSQHDHNGDGRVDLDDPAVREKLRTDFQHLEETYFDEPTYVTVDGRPLVYCYATFDFRGAVRDAFQEARDAIDADPYLVADRLTSSKPWIDEFDAVTAYSHYDPDLLTDGDFDVYVDHMEQRMRTERGKAGLALDYIPHVAPGYNDTKIRDGRPVLERDPDGFRALCGVARDQMDADLDAVLITSWNEWPEYTSVEPAESFGTTYLEIIADELVTAEPPYMAEDYGVLRFDFDRTVRPDNTEREHALWLDTIELQDAAGEVTASYDIGVMDEEPLRILGAYEAGQHTQPDGVTEIYRWLGTPAAASELHFGPGTGEKVTATFHAMPAADGIEADISYNDQPTDHIDFGKRDPQTYSVSLRPEN